MGLIKAIRKGVIASRMANETNELNEERVRVLINEFIDSNKKRWMDTGERYYRVDNDIMKPLTKEQREDYKSHNQLAHAKYKGMVDEKVSYLLSKPYTLGHYNKKYLETVKAILEGCRYTIFKLGYESSNKGIGWLQIYLDEKGEFKTMIIPSEQCIPIWHDSSHERLDYMIRAYNEIVWQGNVRVPVTSVEVWSAHDVKYYRLVNDLLVPDPHKMLDEYNGPTAHYRKDGVWTNWGRVPFVPFKNNIIEFPDIKFIKSLIDGYDHSRSETANYVDDAINYLVFVYGYGGGDKGRFMRELKEYRMALMDDKSEGGVDIATPPTDVTSIKEHYEQLKRDIFEDGQSINKDLDKFGSAPSGVALKFLYSGLELKANAMAQEYQESFKTLQYFINHYLKEKNQPVDESPIEVTFNVDMKSDETETITNCSNSRGVISDETILANHPWVKDAEEELKKLKEQSDENNPFKDKVPVKEDGNNEE